MGGRSGGGGRSSSSGRSSFFSSNKPSIYSYSSPRTPRTPVAPTATAPTTHTTHTVKVEQPGFFSNVMQGFGLGAGQSMAFNLFKPFQSSGSSSVSNTVPASPAVPAAPTKELPREYVQCMKEYDNKKDLCKQYLDNDSD